MGDDFASFRERFSHVVPLSPLLLIFQYDEWAIEHLLPGARNIHKDNCQLNKGGSLHTEKKLPAFWGQRLCSFGNPRQAQNRIPDSTTCVKRIHVKQLGEDSRIVLLCAGFKISMKATGVEVYY